MHLCQDEIIPLVASAGPAAIYLRQLWYRLIGRRANRKLEPVHVVDGKDSTGSV